MPAITKKLISIQSTKNFPKKSLKNFVGIKNFRIFVV